MSSESVARSESVRLPGAALIIPALNEEAVIGSTLASIAPTLFEAVVVADNGSEDRTAEIAAACGAMVISEPERGYGAACLRALAALPDAIEYVAFLQADGSEDPEEAVKLLAPLYDGRADLVIGSRTAGRAEKGALLAHQQFGNWLAVTMIRLLYGHRYTDLGPFRGVRVAALRRMGMRERNYGWTVEMQVRALQLGLRVMEVPVSYRKRVAGENKVSGNLRASVMAGYRIIATILRLWFSHGGIQRAPG